MANTTPNKESIRRICRLYGGSYCFLIVDTGTKYVDILTDIGDENMKSCLQEMEDWCGMKFNLYNEYSANDKINYISKSGEKILPIKNAKKAELNSALDIC